MGLVQDDEVRFESDGATNIGEKVYLLEEKSTTDEVIAFFLN
ncbi:MAG TPA: hypothetical protein VFW11_14575 [Cyclobacteriaceae bacterium]|nr:hypothetical protein [Cyclobacteriaceae bacterium]